MTNFEILSTIIENKTQNRASPKNLQKFYLNQKIPDFD